MFTDLTTPEIGVLAVAQRRGGKVTAGMLAHMGMRRQEIHTLLTGLRQRELLEYTGKRLRGSTVFRITPKAEGLLTKPPVVG